MSQATKKGSASGKTNQLESVRVARTNTQVGRKKPTEGDVLPVRPGVSRSAKRPSGGSKREFRPTCERRYVPKDASLGNRRVIKEVVHASAAEELSKQERLGFVGLLAGFAVAALLMGWFIGSTMR